MACFAFCNNEWEINVNGFEYTDSVTYYQIKIRFGQVVWTVKRRYSEFVELADRLAADHGLSKDSLPPKKFSMFELRPNPELLNRRVAGLEEFLKISFDILKATMPRTLVVFLAIDSYEIFYVLESLSLRLSRDLTNLTAEPSISSDLFSFTLLEVHALAKVLKLPRPPLEIYGLRLDYSDIFEMCRCLSNIEIVGSKDDADDSNLSDLNLTYDLSVFKRIKHLTLTEVNIQALNDVSNLRKKLVSISVDNCNFTHLYELFLCDQTHKVVSCNVTLCWPLLTEVVFTNNRNLLSLEGAELAPNLKRMMVQNSMLQNLKPLKDLKELHHLDVSGNSIVEVSHISNFFPDLISIDLSCNRIESLKGIECLKKLGTLNLSFNKISFEELKYIAKLPMIYDLVLLGNPITTMVDYRIKVLVEFGTSYQRITLDNEESTTAELNRVAIIQALNMGTSMMSSLCPFSNGN